MNFTRFQSVDNGDTFDYLDALKTKNTIAFTTSRNLKKTHTIHGLINYVHHMRKMHNSENNISFCTSTQIVTSILTPHADIYI